MTDRVHILGGIDEAGLGPLLGPLVVAGLVLSGPTGRSPWQTLAKVFCKKPRSRRDRRVRVDDSKRVNQGARGRAELERTALTLHYVARGAFPANVAELLRAEVGKGRNLTDTYPWYRELGAVALPRWNDRDTLELAAHVAAREMLARGVRALAYPFHLVDVGRYNELIHKHDNKGIALFDATVPVMRACLRAARTDYPEAELTLVVDRHGAREHYRELLRRAFPKVDVETAAEGSRVSRYRLGEHTQIVFAEDGESRAFPTAAGSCLAKYARELLVEQLNAWFLARRPGLAPTAGYFTDGRRFLEDLGPLRHDVPEGLLVRVR